MRLLSTALIGAMTVMVAQVVPARAGAQTSTQTTAAPPPATQAKPPATQTKAAPQPAKGAVPPQIKVAPPVAKPPTPAQTKSSAPTQAKSSASAPVKPAAPPPTKTPAPPAKPVVPSQVNVGAKPADGSKAAAAVDTSPPVVIMREAFSYEGSSRRDPFLSLLSTNELRPALSDLKLNHIVFSPSGGSVANIRDNYAKKPVTAQIGTQLGRMRVVAIHPNAVVFSIEEFGTTRRDSLVVKPDSTK